MLLDKAEIDMPLGQGISARILNKNDVSEDYLAALNNPLINKNMVSGRESLVTNAALQSYIEENYSSDDALLFGLFDADATLLGTSRIHDLLNKNPWMGVLIFNHNMGQGLGSALVRAISDYALLNLDATVVSAGIYKKNIPSIKCFEKAGFSFEKKDEGHIGPEREIWIKSNVSLEL